MKVLIINTNRQRSPHTLIPLGACLVAASARSAGHQVRFLDLTFHRHPEYVVSSAVKELSPDVTGLSVRNLDNCEMTNPRFHLAKAKQIVGICRSIGAGKIIVGGPAVSAIPAGTLAYLCADIAVVGEGEQTFPAVLAAIENGDDLTAIPGVLVHQDGEIQVCKPYVHPDLSLTSDFCLEKWLNLTGYHACDASMPVQTKRGCPFCCSYCTYPDIEGHNVRLRDPLAVCDDILRAANLGFRSVEFVDSVVNVPEDHAIACFSRIAKLTPRIPLITVNYNPSTCSKELVSAMSSAGFASVGCTAESGSDRMLASLQKGFTTDDLYRTARELKNLDALKLWIFMLGGPGEDESTVAETAGFINKALSAKDLVYITCGVRILPGTSLHEQALDEGYISPNDDLLRPAFYFSPHLTPKRAMEIIYNSDFPSSNIVTAGDGNSPILPFIQRIARRLGVKPPYWRFIPLWNRVHRLWQVGKLG